MKKYGFSAQEILELEGDNNVIIDNHDSENLKLTELHLVPVLVNAIKDALSRPNYKNDHLIDYEELSTKERIELLLSLLKQANVLSFSKTLRKSEGKKGAVVTLLASLELAKDGLIELVQNNTEELFIKSLRGKSIE